MTSAQSLLLHTLSDSDDECDDPQKIYDEEGRGLPASSRAKHHRYKSHDVAELISRARWKSLSKTRILSIAGGFTVLLLLCLWLLSREVKPVPTPAESDLKYFFVFGDSYSKTRFNPWGATPSAANPFGNPSLQQLSLATSAGGPNWVHQLTTKHNSSLVLTYNYAHGGATIDKHLVHPPNDANVQDFNNQLYLFNKTINRGKAPHWTPENSIAAIWFGQNDVDQIWNRTLPWNKTMDADYTVYFKRVQDLWQIGIRDFLFIGVAPVSNTVLVRKEQNATEVARLSTAFNERLHTGAQQFAKGHLGMRWHYHDPAPAFQRVLDKPKAYGLKDGLCMDYGGVDCPWRDHYHPGVRIHEQVAADIAALDTTMFGKANISWPHR